MLIRFKCPACNGQHVFDMPETTLYLTCSRTAKTVRVHLTSGGDVKSQVWDGHASEAASSAAEE